MLGRDTIIKVLPQFFSANQNHFIKFNQIPDQKRIFPRKMSQYRKTQNETLEVRKSRFFQGVP